MECEHKWIIEGKLSEHHVELLARCSYCNQILEDCDCRMSENIYTVDETGRFYILICKECGKLKEIGDVVDELYD